MAINNTLVDVLQDQRWESIPWKRLQVGDIVRVSFWVHVVEIAYGYWGSILQRSNNIVYIVVWMMVVFFYRATFPPLSGDV